MTINLTLSTIGGLKLFDQVFAITNGGPGYSTETLSTLIYKQAFVFGAVRLLDRRRARARRCWSPGWRCSRCATCRAAR